MEVEGRLGFSESLAACACCEGLRIRVAAAETSGILGLWSLTPRLAGALGRQDQWTPLHAAASNGHVEAAKVLVEAKADVDTRNKVRTLIGTRKGVRFDQWSFAGRIAGPGPVSIGSTESSAFVAD